MFLSLLLLAQPTLVGLHLSHEVEVIHSDISKDGHSQPSPVSQFPAPLSTSTLSPATSHGDEALNRVDSSRVQKRKLNTLAARRCRQRRVDRMKELEDELAQVRKERDDWRLQCSKLEGETNALKSLLSRKSMDT